MPTKTKTLAAGRLKFVLTHRMFDSYVMRALLDGEPTGDFTFVKLQDDRGKYDRQQFDDEPWSDERAAGTSIEDIRSWNLRRAQLRATVVARRA